MLSTVLYKSGRSCERYGVMVGKELRRLRGERDLSPTELARLSQVSRARIYAIEDGTGGHPTLDTLHKLAQGLSAWRDSTPDPPEFAEVFRCLVTAAGYPVQAAAPDGEATTTPIPEPLAASILEIVENWARWSQLERETATRLLDVASDIGRPDADTVGHDGDPGLLMKRKTNLALYLDWPLRTSPDALRIDRAPIRELVPAGR